MRALYPYRIWIYIALAAALLAVPLVWYTHQRENVLVLLGGTAALTLIAYIEIFSAVRRNTRVLRAMYGQRDLLVLANVNLTEARRGIWHELWRSGGWTALGALWIGRFSVALALAQYLFVAEIHLGRERPLNQLLNLVFSDMHSNYYREISMNPVWWQRIAAAVVLLIILLAESRLMATLGMLLYVRPLRQRRWAYPAGAGIRLVLMGIAALAIFGLFTLQTALFSSRPSRYYYYPFYFADSSCLVSNPVFARAIAGDSQFERETCAEGLLDFALFWPFLTGRLSLFSLLDGGMTLSAKTMRVGVIREYTGTYLEYRTEYIYSAEPADYSPQPTVRASVVASPLWPLFGMFGGGLAGAGMMLFITRLLFSLMAWRYHVRSSSV